MKNSKKTGFLPTDILIPKGIDMQKWSVVACDQFTSEPDYWNDVEKIVGDSPSALNIIFPEIYLESCDVDAKIADINKNMDLYIKSNLFNCYKNSFLYVERTVGNNKIRKGLIGAIDLETYDYKQGSKSLVRATEGTVIERIPPRIKIRKDAPLELPHVMLLIDDYKNIVIGNVEKEKSSFEKVYDFDLMKGSGHITGYLIPESNTIEHDLNKLISEYGDDDNILLYAVGDGNHSLATAKECWNNIKQNLPDSQKETNPARYALVELVNIHDESLEFEPIHRVLFDCEPKKVIEEMCKFYETGDDGQRITYTYADKQGEIYIKNPPSKLSVGTLQKFLDEYIAKNGGRIDYIHGDDVVKRLSANAGNIGFILDSMEKSDLFVSVIEDGALPRKTFSMGEAKEKRFYLECRKIIS